MKFNNDVKKRILDALALGSTQKIACQYAGISQRTFTFWKDKANQGDLEYKEFFEDVDKAIGNSAIKMIDVIESTARNGEWKAAAWLLARRFPEDYSKKIIEEKAPSIHREKIFPDGWAEFSISQNPNE